MNQQSQLQSQLKQRKAERLENNKWIEINPIDLKKGDTFRVFEPDGTPILSADNNEKYVAGSDAYYIPDPLNNGGMVVEIEIL